MWPELGAPLNVLALIEVVVVAVSPGAISVVASFVAPDQFEVQPVPENRSVNDVEERKLCICEEVIVAAEEEAGENPKAFSNAAATALPAVESVA